MSSVNSGEKNAGLFGGWGRRNNKTEEADDLMPEPFSLPGTAAPTTAPTSDMDGGHGVTVVPWTPSQPAEEAFLSPYASSPQDNQLQQQQQRSLVSLGASPDRITSPTFTMTTVATPPPIVTSMQMMPPPPGALTPGYSPGYSPGSSYETQRAYEQQQAYEREQREQQGSGPGGYSQLPLGSPELDGHPVMWVERST